MGEGGTGYEQAQPTVNVCMSGVQIILLCCCMFASVLDSWTKRERKR